MAVTIASRIGYAQVEPNHLSAPRDGGVFAQLPAADDVFHDGALEQGTFVKYDYAAGKVDLAGTDPEWFLVFNEEKLYDDRKQMHRDFAMTKADAYNGVVVPRVFRLSVGDIYTTNAVDLSADEGAPLTLNVGDVLVVNAATGFLKKGDATDVAGQHAFRVVQETTMPDGQPAVKVQVIQ